MKLRWIDSQKSTQDAHRSRPGRPANYPAGYWVAQTDDGNHDGYGGDPLTAVSNLVAQMEREHEHKS